VNTEQRSTVPTFILNDVVKIDTPTTGNHCLIVAEIRQYSGGLLCQMVDYVLVQNPPGTPPMRLRVMAGQGAKSKAKTRLLLLKLYDSLPFNEGLLAVVRDDTKTLVIDEESEPGKQAHEEFWRVNDVKGSHAVGVNVHSDDGNTEEAAIEFWDYSRLNHIEGVETEEFIFVEMNKASGWFEIWRGMEAAPGKIAVG
jgi:hypothetical protein